MPPKRTSAPKEVPAARQLLVTVGSTLFPGLTDTVFTPRFLDVLVRLGVEKVVVQIGKGNPPKPSDAFSDWSGDAQGGKFSYDAGSGAGNLGLVVEWMRYTNELDRVVKEADAVISHAGSGSILMALRAHKPLLVVPNESLMDNHQGQLADALEKDGYLMVSSREYVVPNQEELLLIKSHLVATMPTFLDKAWMDKRVPFPEFDASKFRNVLDEAAGF